MSAEKPFRILIIDDEVSVAQAIRRFFSDTDYEVLAAQSGPEGLALMEKTPVDLLLLDLMMPGMDGMTVLAEVKKRIPEQKVFIQTAFGGVNQAVEAIKNGATDFLVKGDSPEILRNRVAQVYDQWLLRQENSALRSREAQTFSFDGLIGASAAMMRLREMILRVGPSDINVLIQGESGTGKELVAQAIHHHSTRKDQPFVVLDCAAVCNMLIESELFGHEKGAYTGADTAAWGLVRTADKGTLFLDEIGELPLGVQTRLLRMIQERTVRPVGSTRESPVDIRILAATNRNLLDAVLAKDFRLDLYYRLSTVNLNVPPLRERDGDVSLLARNFLQKYWRYKEAIPDLTDGALAALERYDWPGNVRELENVVQGLIVFADHHEITEEDLPGPINENANLLETGPKDGTLASYEFEAIKNALARADNHRRNAARILDISETTLYRKIKQYGIDI